jgi:hypothetical protein
LLFAKLTLHSCSQLYELSSMASVNPQFLTSPARSDSLRSVSSTNSNVSLTRKPCIRSRSGAGNYSNMRAKSRSPRDESHGKTGQMQDELDTASPPVSSPAAAPPRPTRSPNLISTNSGTPGPLHKITARRPATTETSMGSERGRNVTAGPSKVCFTPFREIFPT